MPLKHYQHLEEEAGVGVRKHGEEGRREGGVDEGDADDRGHMDDGDDARSEVEEEDREDHVAVVEGDGYRDREELGSQVVEEEDHAGTAQDWVCRHCCFHHWAFVQLQVCEEEDNDQEVVVAGEVRVDTNQGGQDRSADIARDGHKWGTAHDLARDETADAILEGADTDSTGATLWLHCLVEVAASWDCSFERYLGMSMVVLIQRTTMQHSCHRLSPPSLLQPVARWLLGGRLPRLRLP